MSEHERIVCSNAVLLAARRRGISLYTLSAVLGVSHQAIHQRIRRYEIRTGLDHHAHLTRRRRRSVQNPVICKICGKVRWSLPSDAIENYCSRKCYGIARRIVHERNIRRAIALRENGYPWKRIAKMFGVCQQTIQGRIWNFLFENRQLVEPRVREIWYHHPDRMGGRLPAWNWLIRQRGIAPSTDGGYRIRGESKAAAA